MKKINKPGDRFNKFQAKKYKFGQGKLRSSEAVVKSEQNASHQFTKSKKKMTNIGLTKKRGEKVGKTNIGMMRQTGKQTEARKKRKLSDVAVKVYRGVNKIGAKIGKVISDRKQAQRNFENRTDNSNYYGSYKSFK